MSRKRVKKFFATYQGKQKHISLSPGIGKIISGEPFEVDERMANTLKQDKNFVVRERTGYAEV